VEKTSDSVDFEGLGEEMESGNLGDRGYLLESFGGEAVLPMVLLNITRGDVILYIIYLYNLFKYTPKNDHGT